MKLLSSKGLFHDRHIIMLINIQQTHDRRMSAPTEWLYHVSELRVRVTSTPAWMAVSKAKQNADKKISIIDVGLSPLPQPCHLKPLSFRLSGQDKDPSIPSIDHNLFTKMGTGKPEPCVCQSCGMLRGEQINTNMKTVVVGSQQCLPAVIIPGRNVAAHIAVVTQSCRNPFDVFKPHAKHYTTEILSASLNLMLNTRL